MHLVNQSEMKGQIKLDVFLDHDINQCTPKLILCNEIVINNPRKAIFLYMFTFKITTFHVELLSGIYIHIYIMMYPFKLVIHIHTYHSLL